MTILKILTHFSYIIDIIMILPTDKNIDRIWQILSNGKLVVIQTNDIKLSAIGMRVFTRI